MGNLIVCAVILVVAPVNAGGGAAENAPNGWSNTGQLTDDVGIQTPSREPVDAFSLAGRPTDSSSPESIANAQHVDAEDVTVLPPRLPSLTSTEQVQQEGGQSQLEASRGVSSAAQRDKKFVEDGRIILSVGLFVVTMAFIAKAFSSKLALKEGIEPLPSERPQAKQDSLESEPEVALAEGKGGPLEQRAQEDMETSPPEQSEQDKQVCEVEDRLIALVASFRRATLRAENWANRSEGVLLSGSAEEGNVEGAHSASWSLLQKVSSIAHSLAQSAGPLCRGLESLTEEVKNAKTLEEAVEASDCLRKTLRALESIGDSSIADFHKVIKLTIAMTSQARTLLDMYPEMFVLANNLSEPLTASQHGQGIPTSATEQNREVSVANLKKLVEAVSVKEDLQDAKMKKVLRRPLTDPHFARLFQLLLKSQDQQEAMRATLESLSQSRRKVEEGRLPFDRLNVDADVQMLLAIKAKQVALGEEMKLELDLCILRALEQIEAASVLLDRGDDGRWKKTSHPLVSLTRTIRKHVSSVEAALSKWEERVRGNYP